MEAVVRIVVTRNGLGDPPRHVLAHELLGVVGSARQHVEVLRCADVAEHRRCVALEGL